MATTSIDNDFFRADFLRLHFLAALFAMLLSTLRAWQLAVMFERKWRQCNVDRWKSLFRASPTIRGETYMTTEGGDDGPV